MPDPVVYRDLLRLVTAERDCNVETLRNFSMIRSISNKGRKHETRDCTDIDASSPSGESLLQCMELFKTSYSTAAETDRLRALSSALKCFARIINKCITCRPSTSRRSGSSNDIVSVIVFESALKCLSAVLAMAMGAAVVDAASIQSTGESIQHQPSSESCSRNMQSFLRSCVNCLHMSCNVDHAGHKDESAQMTNDRQHLSARHERLQRVHDCMHADQAETAVVAIMLQLVNAMDILTATTTTAAAAATNTSTTISSHASAQQNEQQQSHYMYKPSCPPPQDVTNISSTAVTEELLTAVLHVYSLLLCGVFHCQMQLPNMASNSTEPFLAHPDRILASKTKHPLSSVFHGNLAAQIIHLLLKIAGAENVGAATKASIDGGEGKGNRRGRALSVLALTALHLTMLSFNDAASEDECHKAPGGRRRRAPGPGGMSGAVGAAAKAKMSGRSGAGSATDDVEVDGGGYTTEWKMCFPGIFSGLFAICRSGYKR